MVRPIQYLDSMAMDSESYIKTRQNKIPYRILQYKLKLDIFCY
jgi:hypothetical protein